MQSCIKCGNSHGPTTASGGGMTGKTRINYCGLCGYLLRLSGYPRPDNAVLVGAGCPPGMDYDGRQTKEVILETWLHRGLR